MINKQTSMTYTLILDMDQEILENDYTQEFKDQYGIINLIPTGYGHCGLIEMEVVFNSKESKDNYVKELDIDEV
jgi:hypothetical protein